MSPIGPSRFSTVFVISKFAAIGVGLFFAGCATTQSAGGKPVPGAAGSDSSASALSSADRARAHKLLEQLGASSDLPAFAEERIAFHLSKLAEKDHAEMERRRALVWPAMKRELTAAGLPEGLGMLAYVESRFQPGVLGGAACAGLWQFTAPTARNYGLRVDDQVDERLDVDKSSHAAALYFVELRKQFGDDAPLLWLAGYNAGETKLRAVLATLDQDAALSAAEKRSFWTIYQRKLLSEETSEYVPKFIAAGVGLLAP